MTTILVSNKFWNTLTDDEQVIFQKASLEAARKERQWSIEDAEKFESQAKQNGVSIVDISDKDRNILKRKAQMTYVKYKYHFSDDLIKRIRTLH
jgi:TRAP-type C4-dicarboxylate transport system substrate-binding protein